MSASHVKSPFGRLPESFHHNIPHGREQEQAETAYYYVAVCCGRRADDGPASVRDHKGREYGDEYQLHDAQDHHQQSHRDAVRSSRHQLVKASGLRWISLMWLGQVPWAGRHWALPVLTVLAPSTRYYQQQGRRHKKLTDWARQMVMQLRRWLPQRPLVLVGDNSYAVLDLLHCCQFLHEPVTLIARLRKEMGFQEVVWFTADASPAGC